MSEQVEKSLQDEIVAAVETGGREPGGAVGKFIIVVCFTWALFQLFIASNLPFWFTDVTGFSVVVTNSNARLIHMAFGLFLASLAFPLFKSSSKTSIPWYDWLLAITGVACCLYIVVLRDEIAVRAGLPTQGDLIASTIGMLLLGITVYRALGLPLLIVATVFVSYVFFGNSEMLPETHPVEGCLLWQGHVAFLDAERGRVRRRARRVGHAHLPLRAVRVDSRKSGRRKLFHQDRLCPAWTSARWSGQGRGRRVGALRTLFGFVDCQRGDHGYLYHSADEAYRVFGGERRVQSRSPRRPTAS